MTGLSIKTIFALIVLTVVQHESGVAGWFILLIPVIGSENGAAVTTFVLVSVIDWISLLVMFLILKKSFRRLLTVRFIRRFVDWLQSDERPAMINKLFNRKNKNSDADEEITAKAGGKFKQKMTRFGYAGIFICALIPAPAFREVGILMALTPKYEKYGFWVTYSGGILKTIMTLLASEGIYSLIRGPMQNIL
jgi:hypothetical protein